MAPAGVRPQLASLIGLLPQLPQLIRSRKGLLAVAVAVAGALGYGIVDGEVGEQAAQQQAVDQAAVVAKQCDSGQAAAVVAAGGDCEQSRAVVATQGTVRDGVDGVDGTAGRGIVSLAIAEGRLVVTYTDGAVVDLGVVVGVDGRGIASLVEREGRLLLTYTDGETAEFELPPGPAGQDAPACPPGFSPVEARDVTGADGRTYDRAISCVDPDSVQPAPTPAPAPAPPPTTETTPEPDPPLIGGS